MFGGSSTKVSSANGFSSSGIGAFNPINNIAIGKKYLSTTSDFVGLAVVIVAGVFAWYKFK